MKLTKINTYSFIDSNGVPCLGHISLYAHGTVTPVNGYDVEGNLLPNPVPLDSRGSTEIYVADDVDADAYVYDEDNVLFKVIRNI